MNKSNPSVYPITAGFEEQLKLMGIDIEIDEAIGPGATHEKIALITAASVMHETLGEYEHGTADPEELIGAFTTSPPIADPEAQCDEFRKQALITLRNVYIDLLLTMGSK